MTIELQVVCPEAAEPGQRLVVAQMIEGAGLDLTKAVTLERVAIPETSPAPSDEEDSSLSPQKPVLPTFCCELPVPEAGSEYKLCLVAQDGSCRPEPLEKNRVWPSSAQTGLCDGTTFKTQYGDVKTRLHLGRGAVEAEARKSRDITKRQGSMLQENLDKKADNAYYHAHNREFYVPEDAKVITGEGLITGGTPQILEVGVGSLDPEASERTVELKEYSWCDGKDKVKVYVALKEGLLAAGQEDLVECAFTLKTVDLRIHTKPRYRLKLDKLNGELSAESCSKRVEPSKNRIVLVLAKKRETTWYSLLKSK